MTIPSEIGTNVLVPPLKGDALRSSTVLPYLDAFHYGSEDIEHDYYTEHDLTSRLRNNIATTIALI